MNNLRQNLSITERINLVLNDNEFINHCHNCKKNNADFYKMFAVAEKIASIDVDYIFLDESLLYPQKPFSKTGITNLSLMFYQELDRLSLESPSLSKKFMNNKKYFTTDDNGDKERRSCCRIYIDENGNQKREIFCKIENRITDPTTCVHEFCHSMSKTFEEGLVYQDKRMAEVCPVILDAISNHYFKNNSHLLQAGYKTNEINSQIVNVIKAREVLLEGLVIKVATGEMTYQEAVDKYSHIFQNQNIILRCLDKIENYKFANMFEYRYLLPQAIALKMLDKFKENPSDTISKFKQLLAHDHEWTVEQTLKFLNLPTEEKMIDDYVDGFDDLISQLCDDESEL